MSDADDQIAACIAARRSFLLDAGAGAGKTSSLVKALRHATTSLGKEMARRGQGIACITYTNVAKDEIIERTGHSDLIRVSTIHDFLWDVLKGHQRALRRAVLKVNEELKPDSQRRKDLEQLKAALPMLTIMYSDIGSNFLDGRIFHDDLIQIALAMFKESPLLSRLVAARFPFIFVDEYQDASPLVIEVLTERILACNPEKVVIGLFGDKLQHIYDSGVGELPKKSLNRLDRIVKFDNYRCSKAVIRLLNRLRTDIEQIPGDLNLDGQAIYVSASVAGAAALTRVRTMTAERLGWRHDEGLQRELYLTHKLIARKMGYDGLLDAYDRRGGLSRDRLLSGEDSRIDFFLRYIEPLRIAWAEGKSGAAVSVLRDAGFTLAPTQTKAMTAAALDRLSKLCGDATVGDVLHHLQESNLLRDKFPDDLRDHLAGKTSAIDDKPESKEREEKDAAFFAAFFALPYPQISAFALFHAEHTVYSTKHGVKGAEFDTVFVVLDDEGAKWNKYSFERYLTGEDPETSERFRRTRNVFYVCCSRARRNLAVVDLGGTNARKLAAVEALFGKDNCYTL